MKVHGPKPFVTTAMPRVETSTVIDLEPKASTQQKLDVARALVSSLEKARPTEDFSQRQINARIAAGRIMIFDLEQRLASEQK